MHPAAELLRELGLELKQLLDRIGEGADGEWQASWTRCRELFARYEAAPPVLDALTPEDREQVKSALADVVRLNAADQSDGDRVQPNDVGLVGRETERVSSALRGVSASRRVVRGQSDERDTPAAGESCDVRG